MPGPETPGPPGDPRNEPRGTPPAEGAPPREEWHEKGFSPATSGAGDSNQPAGIAGAEDPGKQALEFNWSCLALIAIVFLLGAVAWWISGG